MIKLVTIDLDGTLFDNVKNISNENKIAIKKCHDLGVKIVIATGRPITGVKPVLEELGLTTDEDYVIIYNGAKIYNVGKNELISSTNITGKTVKEIYHEANRLGVNVHAFRINDELITPKHNPYTDIEARLNHVEDHLFDFNQIKDDDLFIKAMMIDSEENINRIIPLVNQYFYDTLSVNRSSKIFYEFLNKNSDKGKGLITLAKYLNINIKDTMAIGDAGNDLPMIMAAGVGVVMENAFPEIKKHGTFITKSNIDNGVAYALDKFILNEING